MPLPAPDVEAALLAALRAATLTAHPTLRPPWPALAVTRVGGSRGKVLDTALVQVDAAAGAGGSKSATLAHLERAIGVVRDAVGTVHAGVALTHVDVDGPIYAPDPVTGAPRYLATLTVSSRVAVTAGT